MIFNVLLLSLQILLLSLLIGRELSRCGAKNVIAILLFTAHLVLVEGQAIYVLSDLAATGEPVFYADNVIRLQSFTLANITLTASVVVICISYYLAGRRSPLARTSRWGEPRETLFSYIVVIGLALTAGCLLIQKLGGFGRFYYSMGVMIGGQVFLMTLLSIGKLPLFHKMVSRRSANPVDWLLFSIVALLIMWNSRGTAVFIILQYSILNYFSQGPNRNLAKVLLKAGVVVCLVVMVYGGIRDFVTPRGTFDGLAEYYFVASGADRPKVLAMGDLFYRFMISTFTGLAGILNTYVESGADHDFGITNLFLFTHLIPHSLRIAMLQDVEDWLVSFRLISGSVVLGGYESWFVHLGFPGILIFSIALGTLPRWLHNRLVSDRADRLRYGLLSVYVLNLLLAPLWTVTLWILADLCMLTIYRVALSAGMHFEPKAILARHVKICE